MTAELSLIALLLICVGTLTFLLFKRIKSEKNQNRILRNLSMNELTDFMMKNTVDGSIATVARLFSDILKRTFNCQYIIFLRKKRGVLELNYYHGIKSFNRTDFKIEYSKELMKILKEDFFPRDVTIIDEYLSDRFKNKIDLFNMDKFFPVFWRDNLYGFYVIKSNKATNSNSFRLVIAQLVQSLAAAYHIKWHESKLEQLNQKASGTKIVAQVTEGDAQVDRVLNLMKYKKTDAVIPQIVQTIKDSSQVDELIFIYDSKAIDTTEILFSGASKKNWQYPKVSELHSLIDLINKNKFVQLDDIKEKSSIDTSLMDNLKRHNLNCVTSFPLSKTRQGLLAWHQNGSSQDVAQSINQYKRYALDVFENIEELELLEELSFTDNLTSLSNRRYFYKRLHEELNRAARYQRKLALIIFDIDELKNINDTYGHQAGDDIIAQIGTFLRTSVRTIDVVARYGGDEFCIIMPEADQNTCMKFVNRLHKKILNSTFMLEHANKSINCTVSMGVSIYPDHGDDSKKLIYAADMALLSAKESGRNKVLLATSAIHS